MRQRRTRVGLERQRAEDLWRSLVFGLVVPSFTFREHTRAEKRNLWRGTSSSGTSVVRDTIVATDLRTAVPELANSVHCLEGRWD